MELIKVNQSLCSKCGICSEVCPTRVLRITSVGPKALNLKDCIGCGQCTAVCPNKALDNIKAPLSEQKEINNFPAINSEAAENFLRSRRSIRSFKPTSVSKDLLLTLIDLGRFAPTASNSQGISYVIVNDKEVLKEAISKVVSWMEKKLESSEAHWSFARHVSAYRNDGVDTILRSAPNLILATAPKDFKNGRENTISALTYIELYATTLGLGSCWAGLLEMCIFDNYASLIELFNVSEDKVITGALMVGFPKYKFKRLVDRGQTEIMFI